MSEIKNGYGMLTHEEAAGLIPYPFEGVVFHLRGVYVFYHDGVWHAYGETENGEDVDSVWCETGMAELEDMLLEVRELVEG
jgi:hypothetical protein